ncbi:MAG: phytanoyl-CoA dioxygenase family protein [Armatimonadota bacterium]|nr:phytanoyl-CoA dioxygenase family protein [Armatimonadota bacterium]
MGAEVQELFNGDGFVVVPHLFSVAEVKSFKAEIERILDEVRAEMSAAGKDPAHALRTGVYVGLAARSEFFRQALRDARLLDVLQGIMGPHIEFLSDKVVYKNAATSFASPWHQDWPYWRGCHKISIWVALDDATPANGCLRLIPGSHQAALLHDGDTSDKMGFDNRLRPELVDESTAVTAAVEAGGAVFFHDLTIHGSHRSTTAQDRWVWLPTYRDAREGAHDPPYPWAVAAEVLRTPAN